MKRFGSICTGLICMASVCSCVVDDAYDFSKFNREMTFVPGLSVPIPENMNANTSIKANGLMNLGSSFNNGDGAYETLSEANVSKIISRSELKDGARMDDIVIRFDDVPEGIDVERTKISFERVPLMLALTNPTGVPVKVDAIIKAGKSSKAISWTLTASAEPQVKDDIDISDMLTVIPETVTIADIRLTAIESRTSSVTADADDIFTFDFSAVSSIPLRFKPKSVLVFSTPLTDITTDLSELNFDAYKAVVTLVVNSSIPLSIEGSLKTQGISVVMSRLNANARNQEVTIVMETESGFLDYSNLQLTVIAENDTDKVAVIDDSCTLDVSIKEITLPDGISIK